MTDHYDLSGYELIEESAACDDVDFVQRVVGKNGMMLQFASASLKSDRRTVETAVRNDSRALLFAVEEMQNDPGLVKLAMQNAGWMLEYCTGVRPRLPPRWTSDIHVARAAVGNCGASLEFCAEYLRDDQSIVRAAVSNHPLALQYASKLLQDDDETVMKAVAGDGAALKFASKRLRDDVAVVKCACLNNTKALAFASKALRGDRTLIVTLVMARGAEALQFADKSRLMCDINVLLECVNADGLSLKYAASTLQSSKELTMAAIHQNATAFQYAGHDVRAQYDVALAAVVKRGECLQWCSEKLRETPKLKAIAFCQRNGLAGLKELPYDTSRSRRTPIAVASIPGGIPVPRDHNTGDDDDSGDDNCSPSSSSSSSSSCHDLRNDSDVCWAAVQQNWRAIEEVGGELRASAVFMMKVVGLNGLSLQYAHEGLRDDVDIVTAAVRSTWKALQYASKRLRCDLGLVKEACRSDWRALAFLGSISLEADLLSDEAFARDICSQNGRLLEKCPESVRNSRDVSCAAMEQDWYVVKLLSEQLRDDVEVSKAAVEASPQALKYLSSRMRNHEGVCVHACTRYGHALRFCSDAMRGNRVVVEAAFRQNPSSLKWARLPGKNKCNEARFAERFFSRASAVRDDENRTAFRAVHDLGYPPPRVWLPAFPESLV